MKQIFDDAFEDQETPIARLWPRSNDRSAPEEDVSAFCSVLFMSAWSPSKNGKWRPADEMRRKLKNRRKKYVGVTTPSNVCPYGVVYGLHFPFFEGDHADIKRNGQKALTVFLRADRSFDLGHNLAIGRFLVLEGIMQISCFIQYRSAILKTLWRFRTTWSGWTNKDVHHGGVGGDAPSSPGRRSIPVVPRLRASAVGLHAPSRAQFINKFHGIGSKIDLKNLRPVTASNGRVEVGDHIDITEIDMLRRITGNLGQ